MSVSSGWWRKVRAWGVVALMLAPLSFRAQGGHGIRLGGHAPRHAMKRARKHLGHYSARAEMGFAIVLAPHDPAGLADFNRRTEDPSDPLYHQYLSSAEYKERYAPTDAEVSQVVAYLASVGLTNVTVQPNNLVIDVKAPSAQIERAFQLELHEYMAADGRKVFGPTQDPLVGEAVAGRIVGLAGLSSFHRWHTHKSLKRALSPHSVSSYMTPAKIVSAYGLSASSTAGAGQTLALFELDGYNASDISTYNSTFSLGSTTTLSNVLVGGASGAAGDNTDEVALDIELAMAVSPGLSTIKVYEGINSEQGAIDTYNRIASDNVAKVVSTSWGLAEDEDTSYLVNQENTIFTQMKAQNQGVYASSGDSGAFDDSGNPDSLQVDDPASQVYVTAVGGTRLSLSGTSYSSETSWGTAAYSQGGGGGVSRLWSLPSYQSGLGSVSNKGSKTHRMVPDVSLDADPDTGYAIYVTLPGTSGAWYAVGGTSASAPIWASFMTQVDAALGSHLGFANTNLYRIAQSSLYASTFHDIADGSTNLYFPTTSGYDLSTGLGSMRGSALLSALTNGTLPPTVPTAVATAVSGGAVVISWTAATGATGYTVYRSSTFSGTFTALGSTASTSLTDNTTGGSGFYYQVVASNSQGTSGASARVAGSLTLALPVMGSGLSVSGTP